MITCPYCQEENIDGVDECQECGQPLDFLSKPRARSPIERSIIKDRVAMLAPRKPITVDADARVADVLKTMVARGVGCMVVTRNEEMVGIFTERDALLRLNTEAAPLGQRAIADFMTPSPETIEADAPIAFALHKMDIGGYRHIPVKSGGQVTGIISVRDILRYIAEDLMAAGRG